MSHRYRVTCNHYSGNFSLSFSQPLNVDSDTPKSRDTFPWLSPLSRRSTAFTLSLTVCMYVCPKIYIRRAFSKEVTVAPRSQTNRNVFNARLNRSVDKSVERREDGRLFQILPSATAKLWSPNVLRLSLMTRHDALLLYEWLLQWPCWRAQHGVL